jgi:hypothetical protein
LKILLHYQKDLHSAEMVQQYLQKVDNPTLYEGKLLYWSNITVCGNTSTKNPLIK